MRGYLYVLSNPSMLGLLKVGFTNRSVEERINELSSTGVPTRFNLEFFCEVDNAYLLEKEVHKKLIKNHHGKEFFKCKIEIVVRAVKLTLVESNYTIYNAGGRSSSVYLTDDELENIRKEQEVKAKQALEIEKKEEERRLAREDEQIKFNQIKNYFFQTAINSEGIILKYYPTDKYEKIKDIAWGVGILTGAIILAMPFMDHRSYADQQIDVGISMTRKMNIEEKKIFHELNRLIRELRSCQSWGLVARNYYKEHGKLLIEELAIFVGKPEEAYYYGPSSILCGIFKGLYL